MERAELESLVLATGCAERHGDYVFLVDPHWSASQRTAFAAISSQLPAPSSQLVQGWLCIPTGGSSGELKFARHDEVTLGAAARGFADHFGLSPVNSIDVLPPWHVSGLMARVRSAVTKGRHVAWSWKELEQGACPELADGEWTLSLVPTQLQRLLTQPQTLAWLRQLALIPLGGGPVWPALAEAARAAKLPVIQCYGMTETAAMVTAQLPEEFAAGDRSAGRPLPQAQIDIAPATDVIEISGASLMRGYLGGEAAPAKFATADLGRLDAAGRLWVQGRRDEVAITGGEKVNPVLVEAVLRNAGLFADVAVVAVPHSEWGEELVAGYVAADELSRESIEAALGEQLGRFERPKRYLRFRGTDWPRNAQGKLNRPALRSAILALGDPRR